MWRESRLAHWRALTSGVVPVVAGLGVGLVLGLLFFRPEGEPPEATPTQPPAASPSAAPAYRDLEASAPHRLVVPTIGVDVPVVPIQNDADRVLQVPPNPEVAGWWEVSAEPGAETGQTLIAGHAVRTGDGGLTRVGELDKGDEIDVVTEEGRMRYRVTHLRTWSRATVAERADELFGQDGGKGRLVLVTCTDWNGQFWEKNVIAFGKPLGEPADASS